IVVQVHGLEGSSERVIAYLDNCLPEIAGLVKTATRSFFGDGVIPGRKVRGLAKDGPVFVVLSEVPKQGNEPPFAVVLAVTDYKPFRDNVLTEDEVKALKKDGNLDVAKVEGKEVYFLEKKGFAVVTPVKELATALAKNPAGLDTRLTGDQINKLMASDVGI